MNAPQVERYEESHASDDVGLWASGPLAFMFHSTHEQSYVGHVMAFSLCVGPYKSYNCPHFAQMKKGTTVTPAIIGSSLAVLILILIFACWKSRKTSTSFGLV